MWLFLLRVLMQQFGRPLVTHNTLLNRFETGQSLSLENLHNLITLQLSVNVDDSRL